MTTRRSFLKTSATAGLATAAVAAPAIAQSAPEVRWRLTSSFPRSLDTIFGAAQTFAKYVAEATDNKFQIQTFPAGEIVPGLQALDAVSSGAVDCAQTPLYFYFGKDPVLGFATGLPFGLNNRHQQSWWSFGGGAELINTSLARLNAISFVMGNSGTQMGGWFRKEINTLDDIKGLKFRIAGVGGQILARLGAVPQQIAPGDIYPSLERGTIDAAEFVGPYDDEKLGFAKVAKFYYYPGWWEGSAMMHLAVNLPKWNELPKPYQAVIQQAGEAANHWMLAKYDNVNAPALRRLVGGGAVLKAFPLPVLEACYKASGEVYADIAGRSPAFKQALDSVNAYRAEQLPWWQIAEYSFDSMMLAFRGRG
jgi:TRAP-type mannitol/chloroaromatic compound transport system substrate-binding protein